MSVIDVVIRAHERWTIRIVCGTTMTTIRNTNTTITIVVVVAAVIIISIDSSIVTR